MTIAELDFQFLDLREAVQTEDSLEPRVQVLPIPRLEIESAMATSADRIGVAPYAGCAAAAQLVRDTRVIAKCRE